MSATEPLPGNGAMPKDLRKIAKAALRAGWTIQRTGGNHFVFVSPNGARVTASGTPSSRGARHAIQQLRREGVR